MEIVARRWQQAAGLKERIIAQVALMDLPEWWDWDLDFSSHADKRMSDRMLPEAELRAMLEDAKRIVEQHHGTYIVEGFNDGRRWEIIVVPDYEQEVIVVVSAYPDP